VKVRRRHEYGTMSVAILAQASGAFFWQRQLELQWAPSAPPLQVR